MPYAVGVNVKVTTVSRPITSELPVSYDFVDPAVHDAVPPWVRLRLEHERGPRFKLELDHGKEPPGEPYGSVSARHTFSGK
ncbi:MAG: hypothetical protein WKF55_14220 [Gemmatimonadaceae bacterium]